MMARSFQRSPARASARLTLIGAGVWVLLGVIVTLLGQPTIDRKFELRKAQYEPAIRAREHLIHPGELTMFHYERAVELRVLDLRSEAEFNRFHVLGAEHVKQLEVWYRRRAKPNRLVVLVGEREGDALVAYQRLVAMKVANVYVLEGGMNGYRKAVRERLGSAGVPPENAALGDRHPAARLPKRLLPGWEFPKRVKLKLKARKGGGCG